MNQRAGRYFFWVAAIIYLMAAVHAGAKELLIDASARSMWVSATEAGENGGPPESLICSRAMGSDQWQQLYEIASPIAALTHQGNEPAVLLEDGQWMFVYQDGRSLGPELPGDAKLAQLTSSGTSLYGAAWIDGGMDGWAASRPTTMAAGERRLVLLSYHREKWQALAEIPEIPAGAEISLAATEQSLLLVYHSGTNDLHNYQWSAATGLRMLPPITASSKVADFKALYESEGPLIWFAPARGAGYICTWEGRWSSPLALAASANLAQAQSRDICVDGDQQIRLAYAVGDQLFEQNYDQRGAASGKSSEILAQQQDTDNGMSRWLGIAFMALLVFALLSAFRRQQEILRESEQARTIWLAPLARRLGAGLIDISPYLGTVIVLSPRITKYTKVAQAMNDPAIRNPILIAMGIYLLHTTICEIFFARSIGKFLLGLKLVNLRGARPSTLAILARNVCRLIDLPVFFLTILVSPLRQRIGDLAGGTLVVRAKEPPPEQAVPEDKAQP